MNVPQAAENPATTTMPTDVGQINAVRLTDKHVLDLPTSIDQDADLPADIPGDPSEMPCQPRTDNCLGRDAPLKGALERFTLAGLEARSKSCNRADMCLLEDGPCTRRSIPDAPLLSRMYRRFAKIKGYRMPPRDDRLDACDSNRRETFNAQGGQRCSMAS